MLTQSWKEEAIKRLEEMPEEDLIKIAEDVDEVDLHRGRENENITIINRTTNIIF